MFAECLLETPRAQRSRRSYVTLTSFALQTAVIGVLLILPLWKKVALPAMREVSTPLSWGAPPPPITAIHRTSTTTIVQSNLAHNVLIEPNGIPTHVADIHENVAPPQVDFNGDGVPGGTGTGAGGDLWRVLGNSLSHAAPLPAAPPKPVVRPFKRSEMLEGSLIRKVQPSYPPMARAMRVQGQVVLAAVISKAGVIENLRTISGHPMLVPAAIDAVSQWRYRPYILNGEAIEVETQITVNFILGN